MNLSLCFRVPMVGDGPEPTGVDGLVLSAESVLLSEKAMTLFSMLFGAGLTIFLERASARGDGAMWLLTRRLFFLLLFGVAHLFLLWHGDILTEYALAGFCALPFLRARPPIVIVAVVALTLFPLAGLLWPALQEASDGGDTPAHFAEALRVYGTGSYPEIVRFRAAEMDLLGPAQIFYWPNVFRNILVGILVWRSGVLRAPEQHARALRWITFSGIVLGLSFPVGQAIYRAIYHPPHAPVSTLCEFLDALTTPILALGYAAGLLLLLHTRWRKWLTAFAPLGRMAFTNYLTETLIFTTVFYGYGLQQMGRVGVVSVLVMGIICYALQGMISAWWLRRFRFGPFEWVWRSLTYGRLIRGFSVREGEP